MSLSYRYYSNASPHHFWILGKTAGNLCHFLAFTNVTLRNLSDVKGIVDLVVGKFSCNHNVQLSNLEIISWTAEKTLYDRRSQISTDMRSAVQETQKQEKFFPVRQYFRFAEVNNTVMNKCLKWSKLYNSSSRNGTLIAHLRQHAYLLSAIRVFNH